MGRWGPCACRVRMGCTQHPHRFPCKGSVATGGHWVFHSYFLLLLLFIFLNHSETLANYPSFALFGYEMHSRGVMHLERLHDLMGFLLACYLS
jgi:hypothetical protein